MNYPLWWPWRIIYWWRYLAKRPHRWGICAMCGPMVYCGYCGNNCCNGGSGDGCPDRCRSAYKFQAAGEVSHPRGAAGGERMSNAVKLIPFVLLFAIAAVIGWKIGDAVTFYVSLFYLGLLMVAAIAFIRIEREGTYDE